MGQTLCAIEQIASAAIEFWKTGDLRVHWEEGSWFVRSGASRGSADTETHWLIAVVGTTSKGERDRHDLKLFPRDFVPPPPEPDTLEMPKEIRRRLAPWAPRSLYWPGPRDTRVWTQGQVGIWFLQMDWDRTPEDEASIWETCIHPLFGLSKAGRQLLQSGELGYEFMEKIVRNLANPQHPGAFQAYIRKIPRRLQTELWKEHRASFETMPDPLLPTWDWQRFMAFVRQRKHRGYKGLFTHKGRIASPKEIQEKLMIEWAVQEGRKKFIRHMAGKMVEHGAIQKSAMRQVRRWLRETGTPEGTLKKYKTWLKPRSVS